MDGVRARCPGVQDGDGASGEVAEGEMRENMLADREEARECVPLRGTPGDRLPYFVDWPLREAMSMLPPPIPGRLSRLERTC